MSFGQDTEQNPGSVFTIYSKPFPKQALVLRVCSISHLKTLGKGKIAHNEQFLLFPQCFLPFSRTFPPF